jgi:hypothetical protein
VAQNRVVLDLFSFVNHLNPNNVACENCHDGSVPGAPNVMTYWNGAWWAANRGPSAAGQYGGHGDPGGKAALTCVGETGCHDLRLPAPNTHRNGTTEGAAGHAPSPNTFHLRSGFLAANPDNPSDVQVTFDTFCYTACHQKAGIARMNHSPVDSVAPGAVQFGRHDTLADASVLAFPIDRNLTTNQIPSPAYYYALCVSCHNPHGSGVQDTNADPRRSSNRMVRDDWRTGSDFCLTCHQ